MADRFPCSTLTLKGSLRRGSPDRQGAGLPKRGVPAPTQRRGLSSKKPRYPACPVHKAIEQEVVGRMNAPTNIQRTSRRRRVGRSLLAKLVSFVFMVGLV